MSTLDKAFIKAYQRHGMKGPHAPFGRQSPSVPTTAASVPTTAATSDVGSRPASVPKPHRLEMAEAFGDPEVEREKLFDNKPAAEVATTAKAEPAVKSQPPIESESAANDIDLQKPAFEIEQFKWPGVVGALIDNRQAQLTSLLGELFPLGQGTLAVGGCRRGEGRTTVAMVVARQLAQTGARVVLVDADIERPKLAEMLGTATEIGWIETLIGKQPECEAMIESLADRLVLVPLKSPLDDAALDDRSDDLKRMIERLQTAFDYVCLDLGPSAQSRGWRNALFESGKRAAVVVRDVRHCRLEQAQAVGRKFADLGAAHWAIIENFV